MSLPEVLQRIAAALDQAEVRLYADCPALDQSTRSHPLIERFVSGQWLQPCRQCWPLDRL